MHFQHTPWMAFTNFSTFTIEYTDAQVQAYIANGNAGALSTTLLLQGAIDVCSHSGTAPLGLHIWLV